MKLLSFFRNILLPVFALSVLCLSCEKAIVEKTYDKYSSTSFFQNAEDAKSAVTAMYSGMTADSTYGGGYGASNEGWLVQSSFTSDELICSWGWDGWPKLNQINFSEDFSQLLNHYNSLIPKVSQISINIEKIQPIVMDSKLKIRYTAELKALRGHYSWMLYNLYGPVPIRLSASEASDPNTKSIPRPTKEWMVTQIIKDYNEAIPDLPKGSELAGSDYGRMTKDACYMGLMKLYMHEKRWTDAITVGRQLQQLGHSLQPNYKDVFSYANNGSSQEIILAVPCRTDATNTNLWLAHSLPGNYVDPNGLNLTQWGGYKMPWKTYDKFDPSDKRLSVLLAKWTTTGGGIFDARANNYIGAIPMKYGPDPTAISEQQGTNIVVWRYADALLLLAEAINETQGPVQEAYDLINQVRSRAGVVKYTLGQFTQLQFRNKLMDERLFELWCEGSRREDMIRWGTYIQHAKDEGSIFAKPEFVLYPIPRKAITESNGVIAQNPGY